MSTENSMRNVKQQGTEREYREHSQNLQIAQQKTNLEKEQVQQNGHNRDLYSGLREDLRNSLRMMPVSRKTETIQKERNVNRDIHSKFIEHSQQIARKTEHWKIDVASNRSNKYSAGTTNRIQKLSSRLTNIPSFERSNDSTTDRGG